jgi:SPP1 gp7 family putative phage head morphogenesis protein
MDSDLLFGPVPHDEAIDFIKSKPVVSRQVFDGLLPELKARAFTVTGIEGANVLQAVRDRIADLPAGHNWNDVKKDIVDDISPFLVDPDATGEERAGQEVAAERRAELLLRTHGFQAYQAAQYRVMDRQRDVLPFWQYLTMEDERVRPEHAALDQIVLPQDSPFWAHHFPPWDWGCRCQVVPISQEDRDDLAAEDGTRSLDNQLVLEGPQATHLEQGTLIRPGRTYDVRPPTQKEGGSGFSWDPSSLRLPIEQLKQRYDPVTWGEFEAWARKTALGSNQPTVWAWLGGKSLPPPLPGAKPPAMSLDELVSAHTALPGKMTETEAAAFIVALEKPHGVAAASKTAVRVEASLNHGWQAYVEYDIQQFFNVLPKQVLDALPTFETRVVASMADGSLGAYNQGTRVLKLNAAELKDNAALISETIFHELTHWVHLHGPAGYRKRILDHYKARTKGEHVAQLPGYSAGTKGKKDKFWNSYMGRVYTGTVDGCEIPTTAFELLTNPAYFSTLWNVPLHRETIKEALSILFS